MKITLHKRLLIGVLAVAIAPVIHAANPASTNTTTSQGLKVTITAPAGPVIVDGSAINASTTASLAAPPPVPVNLIYITDLSGSMLTTIGAATPTNDCNHDGLYTRLDDACKGLIALNNAIGGAANVNVGMIGFGFYAKNADMDPATGSQAFTSPANVDKNGDGVPDVDQVITGMIPRFGGAGYAFTLFTPIPDDQIAQWTDYESALTTMNQSFAAQPAGDVNIAAFISDGEPNKGDYTNALLTASQAGTKVYTFAVGPTASGECGLDKPLGIIASDTGGTCTVVTDTTQLQSILPAVLTTHIQSLNLEVNGTTVASTSGSEPTTMSLGNIDISSYLASGDNQITSTAIAKDGTSVTADVSLEAHFKIPVQVDVKPGSSVNPVNLKSKGVTTAAVLGSGSFDVNSIVPDSVRLGNAAIAARNNGSLMIQYTDVNGDGYTDLVAKFRTQDLGLSTSDTSITLTGNTSSGDIIDGSDSVKIVP